MIVNLNERLLRSAGEKARKLDFMRAHRARASVVAALLALCGFGARADLTEADYNSLIEQVGQANAWRLIPSELLRQCDVVSPVGAADRRASYQGWTETQKASIELVDRDITLFSAAIAPYWRVSASEARQDLDKATATLVERNYLAGDATARQRVCDDYKNIVKSLADPGRVAAIRGSMYALEGKLSLVQAAEPSGTASSPRSAAQRSKTNELGVH